MLLASRVEGFGHRPFQEFLESGGLSIAPGMDRLLLGQLSSSKYIEFYASDDYDPEQELSADDLVRLSWIGIEAAEALIDEHPEYAGGTIPAADRYVTIFHNQRDELQADLKALEQLVRGDNEASEEDREIALSEIAAFEAAVIQPRVSTVLIERFVQSVLAWMTRTFSKAAIAEVAQRLIQALMKCVA